MFAPKNRTIFEVVIPAKAGIQIEFNPKVKMDFRFRGNDSAIAYKKEFDMIHLTERIAVSGHIDDTVELPFDLRQKSRLRLKLASGKEAALFLTRGMILRGGDLLRAETGEIVQIVAAQEPVYNVIATSPRDLMCAAYHLGNRHVPLQIGDGWLRLEQDYVLRDMLLGLGMQVAETVAPFEPEAGAYGGGHRHGADEDALHHLRPQRAK